MRYGIVGCGGIGERHAEITIEAAEAGAAVLCEKPLAVYADRMDRMIAACEDADMTLAGVFQQRFQPATQRAKAAIEAGDLGEPVLGDARVTWFRPQAYYDGADWTGTRELDGGVLLSQAIHTIDQLQWLVGGIEPVRAVTATHDRDLADGCETTAALSLRFANEALGTVSATTATKGGDDRIEINGTDGSITLAGGEITAFEVGTGEETNYGAETAPVDVDVASLAWGEGHAQAVEDFVEALREGRDPAVTGREARRAVDVILAAKAAAIRDGTVAVADVRRGRIPEANAAGN